MLPSRRFTKRYFIYPYGPSESCSLLASNGYALLIRRSNSRYARRISDVVLNWGSRNCPVTGALNSNEAVTIATSKLRTFQAFQAAGIPHPPVTTSHSIAGDWLLDEKVVGRDLDNGSEGRGITVYQRGSTLGEHRFYTKYCRKQREFRFHVFQDRVIFTQEKLRVRGYEGRDSYIRSHARGWTFGFNHLDSNPVPPGLDEIAKQAVRSCGLDFGAVDLGYHDTLGSVVYEVNTAPGIEGTTVTAYGNAIRSL